MARSLALTLTPAGSIATMIIAIALSLAAEILADWLIGHPPRSVALDEIDVSTCMWVCEARIARYSTTECVCREPGSSGAGGSDDLDRGR